MRSFDSNRALGDRLGRAVLTSIRGQRRWSARRNIANAFSTHSVIRASASDDKVAQAHGRDLSSTSIHPAVRRFFVGSAICIPPRMRYSSSMRWLSPSSGESISVRWHLFLLRTLTHFHETVPVEAPLANWHFDSSYEAENCPCQESYQHSYGTSLLR